jgi:hypothetical protein
VERFNRSDPFYSAGVWVKIEFDGDDIRAEPSRRGASNEASGLSFLARGLFEARLGRSDGVDARLRVGVAQAWRCAIIDAKKRSSPDERTNARNRIYPVEDETGNHDRPLRP